MDKPRPLVLYHANCADGWCAAWVFHRFHPLSVACDFVPVQYGQEPPDVTDRTVWILDFSYKRDVLVAMAEKSDEIVVIDHHKTAMEELAGGKPFGRMKPPMRFLAPKLVAWFDTNRSGARLAWDYCFPHSKNSAPWLVEYVQDRDLWRHALPHSREVNAALSSLPFGNFQLWNELHEFRKPDDLVEQGKGILRYQSRLAMTVWMSPMSPKGAEAVGIEMPQVSRW